MSVKVIQRKNGAWQCWYYDRDGKRKAITLKINGRNPANLKEAEKARDLMMPDLMALDAIRTHEQAVAELVVSRNLIAAMTHSPSELWEMFHASESYNADVSDSRMRQLQQICNSFTAYASARHLEHFSDITPVVIKDWIREATEGLSARSKREYLTTLRQLLRPACAMLGMDNPALKVRCDKLDTVSRQPYSMPEIRKVLDSIETGLFLPYKYKVPSKCGMVERLVYRPYTIPYKDEIKISIMFGAFCGMRLADAVAVKYEDVRGDMIAYTPQKTRESSGIEVTVPIIDRTLRDMLSNGYGYVTPHLLEWHERNPSQLCRTYKHIFEACGYNPQIQCTGRRNASVGGFHALRHTYVTACANAGIPLDIVASTVGHTTPMMTSIYAKISRESKARELAKVFG